MGTLNVKVVKRYAREYLRHLRDVARAGRRMQKAAEQIRRRVQLGARLNFGALTISRVPTEAYVVPAHSVPAGERLVVTRTRARRPAATPESLG